MDREMEFVHRHPLTVPSSSKVTMRRLLLTAAIATAALAAQSSTALATCYSSTPASQTFPDAVSDGASGLAPEIIGVATTLNSGCALTVDPMILGDSSPGDLIDGENVGIYLDTDGNPSTGSPTWNGADKVVITVGQIGADLPPGLGTWNGTTFSFAGAPTLTGTDAAGFTTTLDTLGLAGPATLGIRTISLYEGIYSNYSDFAPEVSAASFGFPVAFSTVAPAPAATPTPTAPAPTTQTLPTPLVPTPSTAPTTPKNRSCVVPAVKGLTETRALKRLYHAGCHDQIVRLASKRRRGTVLSQAPAAGKITSGSVILVISRGAGHTGRIATSGASSLYSAVEQSFETAQR